MLKFNEIRVLPDSKTLIVDVSVENMDVYSNVKLGEIYLDTYKTFKKTGPTTSSGGSTLMYSPTYTTFDTLHDSTRKRVRLEYPISENSLYYVWVKADESTIDATAATAPCEWGGSMIVSPVTNMQLLYNTLMSGIKQIENSCEIPSSFIDSYLRMQAVETSLQAGQYELANKYWKKFFTSTNNITVYKSCGCNGGN